MSSPRLSVGTDPEFMIVDRSGNYVSAIGILRANKENRKPLGNGHKIFYDNVLAEFNIKTSYSETELISNLKDCFQQAANLLRGYILTPQASQTYPATQTKHQDAQVFGCDPEYCAYDMAQLQPPTCEPGNNFRSAGGHIHLGYDKEAWPLLTPITDEDRMQRDWGRIWVVRMMDLFVGLPSLLIDHDPTSAARRRLYGKAGTHRPKEEYGVEYRATSNFWLQSPRLTSLVYRLSEFAVNFVRTRGHEKLWKDESTCTGYDVKQLRDTIDNSDVRTARSLMERVVKPVLDKDLYAQIFQQSEPVRYNFYREWEIA